MSGAPRGVLVEVGEEKKEGWSRKKVGSMNVHVFYIQTLFFLFSFLFLPPNLSFMVRFFAAHEREMGAVAGGTTHTLFEGRLVSCEIKFEAPSLDLLGRGSGLFLLCLLWTLTGY